MRPILWGTIWFVIGMIGWIIFSVLGGTLEGVTGEAQPLLKFFMYFFGVIFFFSLPVGIVAEIICWIRKRKRKKQGKISG